MVVVDIATCELRLRTNGKGEMAEEKRRLKARTSQEVRR
jgi:hypothetical protein